MSQTLSLSPDTVAATISGIGLILSWRVAAYTAGKRQGSIETRLTYVESKQDTLATKEQVGNIEKDLREIRGMFRMVLRTDDGSYRSDLYGDPPIHGRG